MPHITTHNESITVKDFGFGYTITIDRNLNRLYKTYNGRLFDDSIDISDKTASELLDIEIGFQRFINNADVERNRQRKLISKLL